MGRFFNMESPLFQFLSRVADLMILNILFIISCIPIVTIGAAWTALYYMTLKLVRNEESYIIKGYWKSFKENFKQSTIIWLLYLVAAVILFFDFRIVSVMNGSVVKVCQVGLGMVVIILIFITMYLFPLQSKFYNTIKNTVKNALLISIRHLPKTFLMIVITAAFAVVMFINNYTFAYGILFWLLLGFSTLAYLKSKLLVKIFDNYMPKEVEGSEEAKDEPDAESFNSAFSNLTYTAPEEEESEEEPLPDEIIPQ